MISYYKSRIKDRWVLNKEGVYFGLSIEQVRQIHKIASEILTELNTKGKVENGTSKS